MYMFWDTLCVYKDPQLKRHKLPFPGLMYKQKKLKWGCEVPAEGWESLRESCVSASTAAETFVKTVLEGVLQLQDNMISDKWR